MNIILCGYHWTGCKALEILKRQGHCIFVYTHQSPYYVPGLADYCEKVGVSYSFENISSSELPFKPDLICSIYYRYIIKPNVIAACNDKIFNLHPSLLPKYRGCSSLTWAMIEGEKKAGFTYHYVDEGCDTGKVILQESIAIEEWDTQQTLYLRVMFESMKSFEKVLSLVEQGYEGEAQEGAESYFNRGCPYDGQILSEWSHEDKEVFIRAMINPPYPVAKLGDKDIYTMKDLEQA